MLFRVNYHNQYYAAYSDTSTLNTAKKLWLETLSSFSDEQILKAAKRCIEASEYLPTLHKMLQFCHEQFSELGLPSTRDAFVEACQAATPKSAQAWSHPAVYLAGRDTDWFFLANNTERMTLPVFEEHYQQYCKRVVAGETLTIPSPESLPKEKQEPLSKEQQQENLQKLRDELSL